jgi:hypothetical protein
MHRSLLFAYLETLVAGLAAALPGSSEELLRVRGVVAASKDTLRDVGYEEFATEDFFDVGFLHCLLVVFIFYFLPAYSLYCLSADCFLV